MKIKIISLIVLLSVIISSRGSEVILFSEDFESDLSQWAGKNGGGHQGQIVADPFDASNSVLNFFGLNVSGDIFSPLIETAGYPQVLVEFDYLGLPEAGSVVGNLGGFLGVAINLNPAGDAAWIAGTLPSAVNGLGYDGIEITDDGAWHSYQIDITAILGTILQMFGTTEVLIMIEDWKDAGGVAGDAYFDNVRIVGIVEDSDGDGVPDEQDECPDSDLSGTVMIGNCDTGVQNVLLERGCTISDLLHEIIANNKRPFRILRGVSLLTNALRKEGVINRRDQLAIKKCLLKQKRRHILAALLRRCGYSKGRDSW